MLLHGSKHHCTTEKSARQPYACQSASFELSFRIHITYHTPNIRIQPTLEHSFPISTGKVPATHLHLAAAIIHQSSINQLINEACMDQWELWNNEDVIFCCFCGQLLWIWHLLSVCQARCGSTLLRRRVFRAFVAYLLNQAVNPTHVSFIS